MACHHIHEWVSHEVLPLCPRGSLRSHVDTPCAKEVGDLGVPRGAGSVDRSAPVNEIRSPHDSISSGNGKSTRFVMSDLLADQFFVGLAIETVGIKAEILRIRRGNAVRSRVY